MRVADVLVDSAGGLSQFAHETEPFIRAAGWTVESLWRTGLHVPANGSRASRRLLVPVRVAQLVRKSAPDVVEIHEPLAAWCAVASRLGVWPPVVVVSHGIEARHWEAQKRRSDYLQRPIALRSRLAVPGTLLSQANTSLRLADHVVTLCTDDRNYVLSRFGREPATVTYVPNGVSAELFEVSRQESRKSVRVLFLGSWIDRKGTPELSQAWRRLRGEGATLTLAGTGVSPETVLSDFSPEVRDSITVIPFHDRRQLSQLLSESDLFVLPSWFEGMPLSLLEAMAAGLPVVATAVQGIKDVVAHGRDHGGHLIPPHDSESLERVLRTLIRDASLRERMGRNAKERARSFTWARTAEGLVHAYGLVLQSAGRSSK